jgi:DNA-binding transcriptional ArsR family regulator
VVTKDRNIDIVLDALGNRARRDILGMLQKSDLSVGDIAARLPVSRPAVSKHLRILVKADLVEFTPVGTSNIFRIKYQGFETARDYLDSFWSEALINFKRAAELQEKADNDDQY